MARWLPATGDVAGALEAELARELPPGHALHGRPVQAVARRDDRDDVAYRVDGERLCIVHLSYRAETDPRWPSFAFVVSLDDESD